LAGLGHWEADDGAGEGDGGRAAVVTALVLLLIAAAIAGWLAVEWRVATAKPRLTEQPGEDGQTVWLIRDSRRGIVYEFSDYAEALRQMELMLTDPGRKLPD
jgi:hypothetical protein